MKVKRQKSFLCVLAFLSLALGLCACASKATGPSFDSALVPGEGKATIYFYRPHRLGALWSFVHTVYDDEKAIGMLDDGGYFYYFVEPGRHFFSLQEEDNPEAFTVEVGRTYFVRWSFRMLPTSSKVGGYKPYLTLWPEDKALEEIRKCRLMQE